MNFYTAQMRKNHPTGFNLDITIKSGDKDFAPTWKLVYDYKNSIIFEEEYTQKYLELMRISYKNNISKWKEILSKDLVIFKCYCKSGKFCHRLILKDIFIKLDATYLGELN